MCRLVGEVFGGGFERLLLGWFQTWIRVMSDLKMKNF
jgi:hypothetical protein